MQLKSPFETRASLSHVRIAGRVSTDDRWVMSLVLAATSADDPQWQRSLRSLLEASALGPVGAGWVQFTAKTRPTDVPRKRQTQGTASAYPRTAARPAPRARRVATRAWAGCPSSA